MLSAVLEVYHDQPYLGILNRALLVTAYYGLFRVGEITQSDHIVKVSDVHIEVNKNKLLFILRSSKTHNEGFKPQQIKITSTQMGTIKTAGSHECPFKLIKVYLQVR